MEWNLKKWFVSVQDLAVGSDVDGMKVKDPMRTLLPVLLHPYSTHDKIRAVLLYIFSLGGTPVFSCSKVVSFYCLIINQSARINISG